MSDFARWWSELPQHWFPRRRVYVEPEPLKDPMMNGIQRDHDHTPGVAERRRHMLLAAQRTQRVPIAVAPGVALTVVRQGKEQRLKAGDEVLPGDFVGDSTNTVQTVFRRLIDEEAVIAIDDEELAARRTPASSRFVVAEGGAVSCKRGIVTEGSEVTPADFERGQDDIDDLVRRGAVIDRQPGAPTGKGKAA